MTLCPSTGGGEGVQGEAPAVEMKIEVMEAEGCIGKGAAPPPPPEGCIRREGTSGPAPEAVRWAVGGGWRRLPKRLGAVAVGCKCH